MFKCEIRTGNDAFGTDSTEEGCEIARILREIADGIEKYGLESGSCRDFNGNNVGSWSR